MSQATTEDLAPSPISAPSKSASTMKPHDFATFNRLAEEMTFYHTRLRHTWDALYTASSSSSQVPPSRLINLGLQFCSHLKGHHDIEEAYWFPVLARKMPGFDGDGFAKLQHIEMHKGLDALQPYLVACQRGREDLRRTEVRRLLDSFGGVLWTHMAEEVTALEADTMSKYWTLEEMRQLPF